MTNASTYLVQARASNSAGTGDWSSSGEGIAGAPKSPNTPTLTLGPGSLSVSWNEPADHGSAITGYQVTYCILRMTFPFCVPESKTVSGSTTSTTLTDLQGNTQYLVYVQAENARGYGGVSPTGNAVTQAAQPAAPAVVTGNGSLRVSWTAPVNYGAAIVNYDVRYRTGSGSWSDWSFTGAGLMTTITNRGIAAFRVRLPDESDVLQTSYRTPDC